MKIIKFFTILITPLIIGIVICITILKVCNINISSVSNLLLSKIPIINLFVETTYNTGLYGISQLDKKELVTSSYNVDFLVSFYQSGKKSITIYPYIIEAGIDLETIKSETKDSVNHITLPNAKITKVSIDESKGTNVIRDAVKIDYNNHILPLKTALERRAKDLALSDGILEKANENAEKYLSRLFSDKYFQFHKENIPFDTLDVINSPNLQVSFSFLKKNMPNQGLRYGNDSIFRRDDLAFKDFSFGYSYKTDWDFNKEDNYYLNKDYITLKLIDPINPKESRIFADATDNYKYILFRDNRGYSYYLRSETEGDEVQLQQTAPDMLYMAMSASKSHASENYKYMNWIEEYDACLSKIKNKRYREASVNMKSMASIRGTMPISFEEQLMQSFLKVKNENTYLPTNRNDDFDFLLKSVNIFDNKIYKEMNDDFQNRLLSLGKEYESIEKNNPNLYQLFYNLPSTSLNQRNEYKKIFIENAEKYDHGIANTLKGWDFHEYMYNVLCKYDDEYKDFEGRGNNGVNLRIMGHEENLHDKEFGGYDGIYNLMKNNNLLKENKEQLVLVFITEKKILGLIGLTKQHNLLILEKDGCTISTNITGKFEEKYTYHAKYKDVMSDPDNITFKIGNYEWKGRAISYLINDIKKSYEYDIDFNINNILDEISDNISEKIYITCTRP